MTDTEAKLWAAYHASRSIADRNALVEYFLPFLRQTATKFSQSLPVWALLDPDDLVTELVEETLTLIAKFDLSRGCGFRTFALPRLLGRMQDALRACDWVPRLERKKQSRNPEHRVYTMFRLEGPAGGRVQSLGGHRRDFVDRAKPVGGELGVEDFWRDVCRGLSRQERLIVLMYFREDLTMLAIGRSIGLSESRVSQMLSKIKIRLRERSDCDLLKVA